MNTLLNLMKNKKILALIAFLIIFSAVIYRHQTKPLPKGLSYESEIHRVNSVKFLSDLTYQTKGGQRTEHEISDRILKAINEAEDFIVLDMFLFNSYLDGNEKFPKLAGTLTKALVEKKRKNPEVNIVLITDKVNTTYSSHQTKEFKMLEAAGIKPIITELKPLRDSNPLYSGVWRVFFQWFGQEGNGWLPNPMAKKAPNVTLRSYLELLNVKANHRKVLATEKTAIISSANPHDASGFHSNIAFEMEGNIISDILKTEQAALDFSGGGQVPAFQEKKESGDISLQLLTEGKIYKHLLTEIKKTKKENTIWIGMFYLADRKVVEELENAADRGVKIKLILDPNQNAFGAEKIGLPNLPVAAELEKRDHRNITIRWYNTGKEQYHSKIMFIKKEKQGVILGGSANFTERNLNDFNLETNVKITAPLQSMVVKDVEEYFMRLWNNEDAIYTEEYSKHQDDLPVFKYIVYRIQKLFGFTTY